MSTGRAFDSETAALMGRALDEAWSEIGPAASMRLGFDQAAIRKALAGRVLVAVQLGQRDPERLKLIALDLFKDANA